MTTVVAKLYEADGTLVGELSDFVVITPQDTNNDVGGWSMDYPITGINADQLVQDQDLEVAVLFDNQEVFRGIIEDDSWDQIQEETDEAVVTISGRDISGGLDFAIVYPGGGPGGTPTRSFTNVTIGHIIKLFIDEARTRGAISNFGYDFTDAADSNGAAWATHITIQIAAGVSVLSMLIGFAQAGYIDWRMNGKTVQIYNPGTVLASQANVTFHRGSEIQDAPRQRTRRTLANAFLVQGDNNVNVERSDAPSIAARGRKEAFLSQGGTEDIGVLNYFGDLQLSIRKIPRLAKTHSLLFPDGSPQPFVDFKAGQFVYTDLTGVRERYRVVQFSCTLTSQGIKQGEISLNDRFAEREVRVAQILAGLQAGGQTVTGTSTTTSVPPPTTANSDTLSPGSVPDVVVTSAIELDAVGNPSTLVTVTWAEVTQNSDATPITDLDHYEVTYTTSTGGTVLPWFSVDGSETRIDFHNVPMGITIQGHVRAVDFAGNKGAETVSALYTTLVDTVGPPAPSIPTLDEATFLSIIRLSWDGKYSTGADAHTVADFHHVEVHRNSFSNFTPDSTTYIGELRGAGDFPIPGDPGTTAYVVLVAVDTFGNKGPKSGETSAVFSSVLSTDLGNGSVTTQKVGPLAITTALVTPSTFAQSIIPNSDFEEAGTGVSDTGFNSTHRPAGWGIWVLSPNGDIYLDPGTPYSGTSCLTCYTQTAGNEATAKSQDLVLEPGAVYYLRVAYRAGVSGGAAPVWVKRVVFDAGNGYYGTGSTFVDFVSGNPVTDGAWHISEVSFSVPAGTKKAMIHTGLSAAGASVFQYFAIDHIEMWKAVNNAAIVNLAVNDLKVNDMAVGKLTAGRLLATWIELGGRLTTATGGVQTGPRVELDGAGLRAYDTSSNTVPVVNIMSNGSATFKGDISGSTGTFSGTVTGAQIQTSADGTVDRVIINGTQGLVSYREATTNLNPEPYFGRIYAGDEYQSQPGNTSVLGSAYSIVYPAGYTYNGGTGLTVNNQVLPPAVQGTPQNPIGSPFGAMQWVFTATAAAGQYRFLYETAAAAGQWYSASFYHAVSNIANANGGQSGYLQFLDVNGAVIGQFTVTRLRDGAAAGSFSTANVWERFGASGIAPAGTTKMRIGVYAANLTATGSWVGSSYVYGLQLEQKDHVSTYCDGNQYGCTWSSGRSGSTSSRLYGPSAVFGLQSNNYVIGSLYGGLADRVFAGRVGTYDMPVGAASYFPYGGGVVIGTPPAKTTATSVPSRSVVTFMPGEGQWQSYGQLPYIALLPTTSIGGSPNPGGVEYVNALLLHSGYANLANSQNYYSSIRLDSGSGDASNPYGGTVTITASGAGGTVELVGNLHGQFAATFEGALTVNNSATITGQTKANQPTPGTVAFVVQSTGGGTASTFSSRNANGSTLAQVTVGGNVQGTGAYTNLSDVSVKKAIAYVPNTGALSKIMNLKPATFQYDPKRDPSKRTNLGFIAQDVQSVIPEAINIIDNSYDETGIGGKVVDETLLGIQNDAIIATLVAAVQELATLLKVNPPIPPVAAH
jgi:hypothetical protein